jgi:Mg-chelatase subunit ChlI
MTFTSEQFRDAMRNAAYDPPRSVLDPQAVALVKAGIFNTVSCAALNFAGRHHVTSNDIRIAEALWTLLERHFTSRADEPETEAVHTPKPQEAPTQILTAIEEVLAEGER